MDVMKRTIKDSVFTFLFRQPEYTLQLYQTLHPEDTDITAADLKLVTIENVLSNGLYNDLGIQAGNRLLLLVEAQSTFSVNITLRLLLYMAATYKEYIEEEKLDIYAAVPVRIPKPELYVVYTGSQKNTQETLYLSDLYEGKGSVDVSVKVLRQTDSGNIIDQYVRFCEIADEERKKLGYSKEAIEAIIQRCKAEGILVPFLESRRKEVTDIMVTLFSEEQIAEFHDYQLVKRAEARGRAEGEARGEARGRAEGEARKAFAIAEKMLLAGMPIEQIMTLTGLDHEHIQKLRDGQR